jgi:hypothetical protein
VALLAFSRFWTPAVGLRGGGPMGSRFWLMMCSFALRLPSGQPVLVRCGEGLQPHCPRTGSASAVYFGGLLAGVIGSMIAALVALVLIASTSTIKNTLGFGLLAVPLTSWAVEWVGGVVGYINIPTAVPTIARWVPAVLVGSALAWCGLRPARRIVAWVLNLAFLWVIPAQFISVQFVLGTRVLADDLQEMLLMSRQILAATLGPNGGALPAILVALTIGLVGAGARALASRRGLQRVNERNSEVAPQRLD